MKPFPVLRRLAAALALCAPAAGAQEVLEEIHVTGSVLESSPTELAQSVTVLREETLQRVSDTNLGETLSSQVGISSSYFGAGASRPVIRGLAGARVRMLEDGIDSLDVSTISDDHAVGIDPLVAEQIEIFRGPTTLLYGSGAVGGVVNTVTNRIPEAVPEEGFEGAAELRGNTAADERTGALALDGGNGGFAWHFDALSRDADDYELPPGAARAHDDEAPADEAHGDEEHAEEPPGEEAHADEAFSDVLENSAIETDSGAFGASWLGESGFFGASVSTYRSLYGVPGHVHEEEAHEPGEEGGEEAHGEEAVRVDLEQTRLDLKGGWLGVSERIAAINLRAGINDYRHVELEGAEAGTRFDNDAFEARLEVMHAPWGAWNGALGLQVGKREFAAVGDEAFVPPVDTRSYGVFLIEQRDAELWQFSLGARLETQRHEPSGALPDAEDTAASLSFAGLRPIGGGLTLALNLALADRLPAAEELYADGPHLATSSIQRGNADLEPEQSRHMDFGVRKTTAGDLTWSVTAFLTRYDDFIYLRDTGLEDPLEALPIFVFDQRDAELRGLEAELFAPVAEPGAGELDLRLFADYVRGELEDGERLPRMPPLRVFARLQYHDDRLVAGLEATRYAEQDDTAPFEAPTAAYTMVNADLRWTLETAGRSELQLFLRGTNLSDELARKHTSLVKEIAPLPGRNFRFGFRAAF